MLNERRGFFIPHEPKESHEVYIGGHPKGKDFAKIVLVNFEIYYRAYDSEPDSYLLPDQLLNLIQADMQERIEDRLCDP